MNACINGNTKLKHFVELRNYLKFNNYQELKFFFPSFLVIKSEYDSTSETRTILIPHVC